MPIELGLWRTNEALKQLQPRQLDHEVRLEDFREADLSLPDEDLLIIRRQVTLGQGKQIDLLAREPEGLLIVRELIRDRMPHDGDQLPTGERMPIIR